jgi:hypothetical protein
VTRSSEHESGKRLTATVDHCYDTPHRCRECRRQRLVD